jgi:hypothetical protein
LNAHEPGVAQPGQRGVEGRWRLTRERAQRRQLELAAEHRRDLGDDAGVAEPVETRGQRIAKGRRDARGGAGAQLDDGLGQLLDEERHAIAAGDDLAQLRVVDPDAGGDRAHHRLALDRAERIAGDRRDVGVA